MQSMHLCPTKVDPGYCPPCWVSSKAQCLLASMEEAINVVQQGRHTEQEKCAAIFLPQRFVIVKTSG